MLKEKSTCIQKNADRIKISDLKLICDNACNPTDIGIIKELTQSWIDYNSDCPKICYGIVENYGTPRETFICRIKQIIDRERLDYRRKEWIESGKIEDDSYWV